MHILSLKGLTRHAVYFALFCGIWSCQSPDPPSTNTVDPWQQVTDIISLVDQISFPDETFNITEYGAIGDGTTMNSLAFHDAIAACTKNGGGKVLVPAGKYLTGPIHLDNNVNLHLEKGAEILFSTNPDDFLPRVHTSFEGTELMNYSPLIYAYKKKNIGITGEGILNGQGSNENWWTWKGNERYGWKEGMPSQLDSLNRDRLVGLAADNVPVEERIFGNGFYLRPNFIEPFECENVLIKGIKIIDAPFWVIHPIKCDKVLVEGVTVESHGPNNDGCDPEYAKNVVIRNCVFNTGDDCIAIKSGRDEDGRRVNITSENIVVQNCKMIDGHGGVVMGSEISAGVKNVFVENCEMDSPNLDRVIRIKTNSKRGGEVSGVYVRNIEVGQVKEAVLKINLHYGIYANQSGQFMPKVNNIFLEKINVKNGGKYGVLADGLEESPISNIYLKDVKIEKVGAPHSLSHVQNLNFENTYINGEKTEFKN